MCRNEERGVGLALSLLVFSAQHTVADPTQAGLTNAHQTSGNRAARQKMRTRDETRCTQRISSRCN